MVELELLEGGECAVTLLGEVEPAPLARVGRVKPIVTGLRLAQVGQCDDHDARDREHDGNHDRHRPVSAPRPS